MRNIALLVILVSVAVVFYASFRGSGNSSTVKFRGEWAWTKSVGGIGGMTLTPGPSQPPKVLKIDRSTYTLVVGGDESSQQKYTVEENTVQSGEKHPFIKLDDGTQFKVKVVGDSLELSETVLDGFTHYYTRK